MPAVYHHPGWRAEMLSARPRPVPGPRPAQPETPGEQCWVGPYGGHVKGLSCSLGS